MVTLAVICLTEIITTITSAILLAKMEGWFPILLAILLLMQMLLNGSVIIASGLLDQSHRNTKQTTNKEG